MKKYVACYAESGGVELPKPIKLGCFDTKSEAIKALHQKMKTYETNYGEDSHSNLKDFTVCVDSYGIYFQGTFFVIDV